MSSQQTFPETEAGSEDESTPRQRHSEENNERAIEEDLQADAKEPIRSAEEMTHLKVFRYDPDVEDK